MYATIIGTANSLRNALSIIILRTKHCNPYWSCTPPQVYNLTKIFQRYHRRISAAIERDILSAMVTLLLLKYKQNFVKMIKVRRRSLNYLSESRATQTVYPSVLNWKAAINILLYNSLIIVQLLGVDVCAPPHADSSACRA